MSNNDAYQAALDYLYSYVDYSRTFQQNLAPENFDLARMHALVAALGHPQDEYPTVHVAGSKGKGSVCAFIASVLQAQGYTVGLYTSPHLEEFTERIQINGRQLPKEEFVALIEEMKPHVEAIAGISTFEIHTALAFLYFARQNVDIAVVEVGLGGRLDATNVITPLVSVITTLVLEHTSILGDTLELIAGEKAGIIKEGVPIVVALQESTAMAVLKQISAERSAPLIAVEHTYQTQALAHSLEGQTFSIAPFENAKQTHEIGIPLLGAHQIENAATAYAALQALNENGFTVDYQAILRGFANTRWPARFEILQYDPVIVVDAAHAPAAALRLRETLDEYLPDRPVVLLIGVSADKDVSGILEALAPRVAVVIASQSTHPRAMSPDLLARQASDLGMKAEAVSDMPGALEAALETAAQLSETAVILATGSIFAAASARIAWRERRAAKAGV